MRKYFPILKIKKGECWAVEHLSLIQKMNIFPVFEFIQGRNAIPRAHVDASIELLAKSWKTDTPCFIDPGRLPDSYHRLGEVHHLLYIFEGLRRSFMKAFPVIRTDSDHRYRECVAFLLDKPESQLCIRLERRDLAFPEDIPNRIQEILSYLQISADRVRVVLDLGIVREQDFMSDCETAKQSIMVLNEKVQPLSITFSGGAFPETLGDLERNALTILPRSELSLFGLLDNLCSSEGFKSLCFGDYAVIYPDFSDVIERRPMNRSTRIRYATRGDWMVFKGQGIRGKTGIDDYLQLKELAKQLVDHPNFDGVTFSWGDEFIDGWAKGRGYPGGTIYPVAVDVNRHLTQTAYYFANLGDSSTSNVWSLKATQVA